MTRSAAPLERDLAATAALTAYSLVVAAGFARVFSGWAFLWDLGVVAVLGHGVSFALRRLRVSGWFAIPFVSALLLWVLAVQQYRPTTTWLIPRGATWDQVELEIGVVRDQFQTAVAPVLYGAGWATLAGFAMVITVVMADSFAFRAEARGEALVPGGVLFVFIAALSADRLRVALTALLIAAGIVTVVALRALHDRRRRVELRSPRSTVSLVLPTVLGTAVAVALLAGVVGPRLPGANAEPLYDTRGRGGGVTNIISPLVDIRSRLTSRGNLELFRVNADAPAYWRVTTLPAFDGQRFSLPQRPLERIEAGDTTVAEGPEIRQQIQIVYLGGVLVPAAADPVGAEGFSDGQRLDLRLNRDTNSLLAPDELAPNDLFRIVSEAPQLTPEVLRAATSSAPPDEIFTDLPDDLPDVVEQLAREVTAGTTTSYDAALALQSWFRDDEQFRYSLEVQPGHGASAIEVFLNERVGYCEQFAATFATMARTLGIPSRVAVGFTQGVLNAEGWYSVIGKNAHAWPELWFDGIGWVPFEPTPARGAPGAESYTGVPAQQDDSGPSGGVTDPTASTLPPTPSTAVPPVTTVPSGDTPVTTTPSSGPNLPTDGGLIDFGGDDAAPPESGGGVPWRAVTVVGLLAAALAGPWAARRVRARRDRHLGIGDRVTAAWARATRAAMSAGVTGRASMTVHEWAAATSAELPVAARPMAALADVVDRVTFGPPDSVDLERQGTYGSTLGRDCELWADQVGRIATDTLTGPQRVRRYFTTWS